MSKNKVTFKMPPLGKQYANQNKQALNKQKNTVKNPVTKELATKEITNMIQQSGIPVEMFVEIGKLAEDAVNDKKKYPKFVDYMVSKRLETAESLKKPDVQMLASMVVIGKVAETMPKTKPANQQAMASIPSVSGPVAPTDLQG
jgi:transcription antitermination factor NusG